MSKSSPRQGTKPIVLLFFTFCLGLPCSPPEYFLLNCLLFFCFLMGVALSPRSPEENPGGVCKEIGARSAPRIFGGVFTSTYPRKFSRSILCGISPRAAAFCLWNQWHVSFAFRREILFVWDTFSSVLAKRKVLVPCPVMIDRKSRKKLSGPESDPPKTFSIQKLSLSPCLLPSSESAGVSCCVNI